MADLQAAKRYAQAAFQIAVANGTVSTWRTELDDVAQVLAESTVASVFADGRLAVESRQAMVERSLAVSPMVMNLAKLLVAKGRSGDARAVALAFGRMADEAEGIAHAQVTTAVQLGPEQLSAIEAQLSTSMGVSVRAVATVDPAILGGLVVRVGDRLVDGSVRTRLKRLRRELEGAR
jgi:F-type H+-transporting ATPase subunit delta